MQKLPEALIRKVEQKTARVGVIGLGYVGLPLAVEFAKAGFRTTGIDVDAGRVKQLKAGRSYITDITSRELSGLVKKGLLSATTRSEILKELDAVVICVPTPLRKSRDPDISYIVSAAEALAKHLHRHQVIVLESTTYPGTTREVILPMLQATGLKVGKDFFLGFSPERIDPGNRVYTTGTIPKVVSGVTPACRRVIELLYGRIIRKLVPVSSPDVAEMVKLLENTFRSVNIGLVNELALMCHRLDVDVWEVIEAAKSKPFGFMAFYPGPGLGGHCLDGKETVVVRQGNQVDTPNIEELVSQLRAEGDCKVVSHKGALFLRPKGLTILSFDPVGKKTCFQPVQWIGVRPYSGPMISLRTVDGRQLTVTDRHPMVVHDGLLQIKLANEIKEGDRIPAVQSMPEGSSGAFIDLIDYFGRNRSGYVEKIRVVAKDFSWKAHRSWLLPILKRYRKDPWEYYRINSIPLPAFLEAEKLSGFPPIDHRTLELSCGSGPSRSALPAVIDLNESFCRLVGYYLSEGCITEDKSIRVRWAFHRAEREYLSDVEQIVRSLGLRTSRYQSKRWQTCQIKVSSNLFGVLLRDILGCGTNSYTMRVPPQLLGLSGKHREALLAGLLRGDGGVDFVSREHTYSKNGKRYTHRFHTASLNYYSVSSRLFQQVVLLLQAAGITPTFKKRKNYLTVFGEAQLRRCADWLDGSKRDKLLKYLEGRLKPMPNKTFARHPGYSTVEVKEITRLNGTRSVYSVEVANTHTFVTSYGWVVHNCIPIDPLYLSWKARIHGFESRFIELASQLNASMPEYVVERTAELLNRKGKALKGSKILLLGVAYKRDVTDVRESPAIEIIQRLLNRGARVRYHDPFVPSFRANGGMLRSSALTPASLRSADCVVIVTDHQAVDSRQVAKHARLILDTRNALKNLGHRSKKVFRL